LRTTFLEDGGAPRQIIHPAEPFRLPGVDLIALPAASREGEMRRLATAEGARSFDLTRGPLFRAVLLQLDGDRELGGEHAVLFTLNHIVSDGWSMGRV